jgi:chromosome segregation ATPase
MVVEVIMLAVMIVSIAIKWLTTISVRDRHAKLAEANEDYWAGKNRHKAMVSDVSMADHEIGRLKRKVRAAEHRLAKLTKEQGVLQQDASSKASIEAEKVRLADEIRKKREES